MFFVQCPHCGSVVEIRADAVGSDRTDPRNVVGCDECDTVFDYDGEIAQFQADSPQVP